MRKLKIFEHISLDGVIQAAGGRERRRRLPIRRVDGAVSRSRRWRVTLAEHGKGFDLLLRLRHAHSSSARQLWPQASLSMPTGRWAFEDRIVRRRVVS
jgi:hypothetical protein